MYSGGRAGRLGVLGVVFYSGKVRRCTVTARAGHDLVVRFGVYCVRECRDPRVQAESDPQPQN